MCIRDSGSIVTAATADATVPEGSARMLLNHGDPAPNALIDATAAVTDIRVETLA